MKKINFLFQDLRVDCYGIEQTQVVEVLLVAGDEFFQLRNGKRIPDAEGQFPQDHRVLGSFIAQDGDGTYVELVLRKGTCQVREAHQQQAHHICRAEEGK